MAGDRQLRRKWDSAATHSCFHAGDPLSIGPSPPVSEGFQDRLWLTRPRHHSSSLNRSSSMGLHVVGTSKSSEPPSLGARQPTIESRTITPLSLPFPGGQGLPPGNAFVDISFSTLLVVSLRMSCHVVEHRGPARSVVTSRAVHPCTTIHTCVEHVVFFRLVRH